MDYAELRVIDLSKLGTTEGRAELVKQARDGMREQGFIYVINHGLSQEQVQVTRFGHHMVLSRRSQNDRIFDIADIPFTQVKEEEKKKYVGKIREEGSYQGYKLRQFWVSILFVLGKESCSCEISTSIPVFGIKSSTTIVSTHDVLVLMTRDSNCFRSQQGCDTEGAP